MLEAGPNSTSWYFPGKSWLEGDDDDDDDEWMDKTKPNQQQFEQTQEIAFARPRKYTHNTADATAIDHHRQQKRQLKQQQQPAQRIMPLGKI